MNNQFSERYLSLLRKQVDEEIQFLVNNGHDNDKIYVPCIFCTHRPTGHYVCYRLNELRQFQSTIVEHAFRQNKAQQKSRKEIECTETIINLNTAVDVSTMPLLNQNI